ncbi:MAG: glycoside hydrolase family 16 protein [Pirellulales bacterium]
MIPFRSLLVGSWFALAMALPSSGQEVARNYQLAWSEDFNADGPPNPQNWSFERGFVRNEELQFYRPENARCEGGLLVIEARRERVENPRYEEGSRNWQRSRQFAEYTSACLVTRRLHEWLYGRFEMRARIDTRPGLWPAWWTLGSARGWPGGGEIDIMEYYQGDLLANVAWLGSRRGRSQWDAFKKPLREFGDAEWANKFHVWRMDWDRDSIELYVDAFLLNETSLEETVNGDREGANPFREPHSMLLNLAIGGTRGGDPSQTEFPARLEVDYVRVYQRGAE